MKKGGEKLVWVLIGLLFFLSVAGLFIVNFENDSQEAKLKHLDSRLIKIENNLGFEKPCQEVQSKVSVCKKNVVVGNWVMDYCYWTTAKGFDCKLPKEESKRECHEYDIKVVRAFWKERLERCEAKLQEVGVL